MANRGRKPKIDAPPKSCPECACNKTDVDLRPYKKSVGNGDPWYHHYTWYRCPVCKERFVTSYDGEPQICTGVSG